MNPIQKQARRAGLLYLLAGITAPFSLIYVPRALIAPGDAAATAAHVRASETLLRLGMASELLVAVLFTFVALALYELFKGVSARLAVAMAALLLVSVPISCLNVLANGAALLLLSGGPFLSPFDKGQLDALAYLFLRLHGQGVIVASLFWGLWLFPFGMLVIRSGFIPRVLGILLFVAGATYPTVTFAFLLLPQHAQLVARIATPLEVAELPIILWLLIRGAREKPALAPAA